MLQLQIIYDKETFTYVDWLNIVPLTIEREYRFNNARYFDDALSNQRIILNLR